MDKNVYILIRVGDAGSVPYVMIRGSPPEHWTISAKEATELYETLKRKPLTVRELTEMGILSEIKVRIRQI